MVKISEVIVVEGRYDKNTLSQIVSGTIVETRGFGIFSDKEKLQFLRRMADKRGLIILTDSDSAGFMIRNYLKGAIPESQIRHAYVPDVYGKEKRKSKPSGEGKLGVEGMGPEIILTALKNAGATMDDIPGETKAREITKTDLYFAGLTGGTHSHEKRTELLRKAGLPENMSANAMLQALNMLYSYDEWVQLVKGEVHE